MDKRGYAVGQMVPGPECDDWDENVAEGADLCEDGRECETRAFTEEETDHRRGKFPFVSAGPTHGNGRLVRGLLFGLLKKILTSRLEAWKLEANSS